MLSTWTKKDHQTQLEIRVYGTTHEKIYIKRRIVSIMTTMMMQQWVVMSRCDKNIQRNLLGVPMS